MYNIKELINILPIEYENYKLRLIKFKDLEWYIENCRSHYYEQYCDFKFSTDISKAKLARILFNLTKGYTCKISTAGEARLVLEDENNSIIGGVTIFEKQNDNRDNILELAYFVIPKHWNKGVAYNMLKNIIYEINKTNIDFKYYTVVIREDNIASINLANKLEFKESSRDKGRFKNNITFILKRDNIDT